MNMPLTLVYFNPFNLNHTWPHLHWLDILLQALNEIFFSLRTFKYTGKRSRIFWIKFIHEAVIQTFKSLTYVLRELLTIEIVYTVKIIISVKCIFDLVSKFTTIYKWLKLFDFKVICPMSLTVIIQLFYVKFKRFW